MRLPLRSSGLLLSSLLLLPSLALPAALSVNGTCEIGSCTSVDSISYGQTIPTTPFSLNYTVGSDSYALTGSYTAGYDNNGTNLGIILSAIYTGTSATKTADMLTVNLFQNIFDNGPGTWDGTYNENFPLIVSSTTGSGSTFMGQLSYDSQSVGVVGPLTAGTYDVTKSATLTGLTGNTLSSEFNLVMDFAAGTQPGASISVLSSVPEPAQTIPVALGLALFGIGALRRKRYSSSRSDAE